MGHPQACRDALTRGRRPAPWSALAALAALAAQTGHFAAESINGPARAGGPATKAGHSRCQPIRSGAVGFRISPEICDDAALSGASAKRSFRIGARWNVGGTSQSRPPTPAALGRAAYLVLRPVAALLFESETTLGIRPNNTAFGGRRLFPRPHPLRRNARRQDDFAFGPRAALPRGAAAVRLPGEDFRNLLTHILAKAKELDTPPKQGTGEGLTTGYVTIRRRTTVPKAWIARELHLGHVSRLSRCWQTKPEEVRLIGQILSTLDS